MKDKIKTNMSTILSIFLILQPVLDLITGICVNTLNLDITFGVIIRMLFLVFLCLTVLCIYKKKKLLIPYSMIGVYFLLYLLGMILYKDSSLLPEVKNLVRTFYFPILLITLYPIKDDIKISNMTLLTVLFLYLIFLFIPTLFGLGYKAYQITKVGTLGFFNSANELSGLVSILTPFMFIIFKQSKKVFPIVLLSILYLVVILMIGTKTPLLALTFTIFMSILFIWGKWIKEKKFKPLVSSIGVIFVGLAALLLIIPKTNFYKNIRTHLNYLGLEHVTDVFKDTYFIDHFIFSSRLQFLDNKSNIFYHAPKYEQVFGIGYINENHETKLIEMDYFDIYYSHGPIGFLVFFMITLYVLYKVLNNHKDTSYEYLMKSTSMFLIIFLAFFTGHIITAPSVSILVVIIVLAMAKRNKKDLLFTSFNMDLGGIEKALLNLVNKIDTNKYNVTIVLEEKKGLFLDRINKNITVKECKVSNYKDPIIRKTINASRKLWFKVLNYNNYDFSCCYTTYSYSSSKLALIGSENTAFYVHSDYRIIYPVDDDFYYFFDSRNIKDYKTIIFVSNENKKGFVEKYKDLKDRCIVLNNFINTNEIREQSEEKIKEKKKKNHQLLVFVGRLDDTSKKVSRQIHLVKEISNTELWIIGDGPDKNKYEEEVKKLKLEDRITFFGRKSNPYPYMKEADYIILTSDYEGFPVTYLEAITLKKNIITTFPTSDDAVDIKKYGNIISKDEKEMVKQVKEILKADKKKEEISLDKVQENRMIELEKIFNKN
ncbi:MAG: O-antigen ligase family protein [Bacilli bacterium]|nr:O-antigen ligase family protein [Bacilli bacterium]